MVEIRPFKAYYYNLNKISTPSEMLYAPPYDVISNEMLKKLGSEPLNITHITLGNRNDSYAHAARLFNEWIDQGIITSDERPCYYAYEQSFHFEDRLLTRTGLVALVRVDSSNSNILPHEKTHPKAEKDRLENLQTVKAMLEQIFLIHDDPKNLVGAIIEEAKRDSNEILSFLDFDDVRHGIYRICEESAISKITELLKNKKTLIADGHHRYETALLYSKLKDKDSGPGSHDYFLATLINARDPGLVMLPTHRLIHSVDEKKIDQLPQALMEKFDVEGIDDRIVLTERLESQVGCGVLGFWFPKKNSGLLVTLKPEFCPEDPFHRLDIFILHEFVLEKLLGITKEMQERKENIEFVKGNEEAFEEAKKGNYQIICLLNAPSIPEVMEIAESGRKMPHKATYFYPKLWAGLLINRL